MIDGLALGETTPGPVIMVVTLVSFVGGYVKAVFGPDSLLLAGAAAATPVTWLTFLPFFVFILMGGPFIETTHNDLKFTASLTAIITAYWHWASIQSADIRGEQSSDERCTEQHDCVESLPAISAGKIVPCLMARIRL